MSQDEILETRDDLRVQLLLDDHPSEPYDDGGSPIIRLYHNGWRGWRAEHIDSITSFKPEHIDRIVEAAARWGSDHEKFERYLRTFHGTTEVKWWDSRGGGGDAVYVTFDTAEWRRHHGIQPGQTDVANMTEWQAYCEGDAWGYVVERRREWAAKDNSDDTMATWEPTDDGSLWGLYGRKYAEEAAREAFEAETQG